MEMPRAVLLAILFLATNILDFIMSSPATAPAFLWTPRNHGLPHFDNKGTVDYRTISPKDLANSILFEGGWSDFVCSRESFQQNMDVALVYVGRKLQSSDISKAARTDPLLLDLLKASFMSSNVSISFPYVDVSDRKGTFENFLISTITEKCGNELEVGNISYMESCSVDGKHLKKLQGLKELEDLVSSKMENKVSSKTDIIVYCDEDSHSEGETLSALIKFLRKTGASYTVLYASDPYRLNQYPSNMAMRFLTENNASVNSVLCDGVCQLKSSLLEGLFVAVVLLVILVSGLCCMMGIDTPARFETPQES